MRLAEENPGWVVGFEDETWWSRLAPPSVHAWGEEGEPLRLEQRSVAKDDPDPRRPSPATGSSRRSSSRDLAAVRGRPPRERHK